MNAQRLHIERKVRAFPALPVSLEHFEYREGEEVDPQVVLEDPTISLYCLDHQRQRAIFVATPPDVDLYAAPFFYQAQYDAAHHLIAVPYARFHALARTVQIDPRAIILMYSTGRCGSTLVSRAFNQADGVLSLSEPDVYTQILALRVAGAATAAEINDLVRSCTLLLCGSAEARRGSQAWALKFRSWGIELGDALYAVFPEARVIFLYRKPDAWAQSFVRMARVFEPEGEHARTAMQKSIGPLIPRIARYNATHTAPMAPIDRLACMWVSVMERCLDLQRQGVCMFAARYEELKTAPRSVLTAMFDFCGVVVSNTAMLDQVLEQDSQAGSTISQANTRTSRSSLSEEQVIEMHRLIHHYAPAITPDTIVPNTFLAAPT